MISPWSSDTFLEFQIFTSALVHPRYVFLNTELEHHLLVLLISCGCDVNMWNVWRDPFSSELRQHFLKSIKDIICYRVCMNKSVFLHTHDSSTVAAVASCLAVALSRFAVISLDESQENILPSFFPSLIMIDRFSVPCLKPIASAECLRSQKEEFSTVKCDTVGNIK